MGRQDGKVQKSNIANTVMASTLAKEHRHTISAKIRGQANLSPADSERPSVHLRWALQQMKLRGWTNEAWGNLFDDPAMGRLGTGPICILESVRSPMDGPATLRYEAVEQKYLRWAFKQLADEGVFPEVPVFVSEWNDAQESFEPIETVMLRAISLAEADERNGWSEGDRFSTDQLELMDMFGLTKERLIEADKKLATEDESTVTAMDADPADLKKFFSDVLGIKLDD